MSLHEKALLLQRQKELQRLEAFDYGVVHVTRWTRV